MTDEARTADSEAGSPDNVTLEILRNSFFAITRQAGRIILRSSFSPMIRDAFDFCVTVIGPPAPPRLDLDVVAMNESLAHFSGVMPFLVRNLLWEYGMDNLRPGDLIAMNHPHKGGNHVYDNAFFKPVFHEGELLGGIAVKAHLMDMGGVAAGGYSSTKRNVWEEGVVISGVPVYKDDQPYIPGFNLYFDNGRLPDNMLADLQALYSAANFAEERLLALARRYGARTVQDAMAYTLDYSDRSMREGIKAIPDGDYTGEDGLDADAFNDRPYRVRATVRKRDDKIEIDFSGSSREAESSINCSVFDAANGAYTALKFICDPGNPNSSGAFRAIDVVIPEGTFIGARPPAPTTMYFEAAETVFNAVAKALMPALGQAGFGGHFGTNMGLLITGSTPKPGRSPSQRGEQTIAEHLAAATQGIPITIPHAGNNAGSLFIAPMLSLGAFGGSADCDGENFVSMSQQNLMDMSVEAIEEDHPLIVRRKEFVSDTAGPGAFRGGAGVVWDREVRGDAEVRPMLLHMRIQPWAVRGGEVGRPGGSWLREPDGAAGPDPDAPLGAGMRPMAGYYGPDGEAVPADRGEWVFGLVNLEAKPNTLFRVLTPGGGGWGDPLDRDPTRVLADVRDGFVSVEGARRDYGVVVLGDPLAYPAGITVDHEATEALRHQRRSALERR
jgi:N-methylhydantoinase B